MAAFAPPPTLGPVVAGQKIDVRTAMTNRGTVEIESLEVALIAAAEKDLAQKNISRVAVNTRFERKEAHEFYDKAGYTRNGFRFVKELPMPAD